MIPRSSKLPARSASSSPDERQPLLTASPVSIQPSASGPRRFPTQPEGTSISSSVWHDFWDSPPVGCLTLCVESEPVQTLGRVAAWAGSLWSTPPATPLELTRAEHAPFAEKDSRVARLQAQADSLPAKLKPHGADALRFGEQLVRRFDCPEQTLAPGWLGEKASPLVAQLARLIGRLAEAGGGNLDLATGLDLTALYLDRVADRHPGTRTDDGPRLFFGALSSALAFTDCNVPAHGWAEITARYSTQDAARALRDFLSLIDFRLAPTEGEANALSLRAAERTPLP
jgi:hypothetical protein